MPSPVHVRTAAEVYVAADRAVDMSRTAAEPPLVITPPAVFGYPSHRRKGSITTTSSWLGALAVNTWRR